MSDNKAIAIYFGILAIILFGMYLNNKAEEREYSEYLNVEGRDAYVVDSLEALQEKDFLDIGSMDDCTQDCSGHEAGFEWAKENNIEDPYDCTGTTQSFIEGCEVYANEVSSILNNPEDRSDFEQYLWDYRDTMYYSDVPESSGDY